jgi:signal transduction histidine kinase
MRLDSIATRIAVALVLAIVLSVALTVAISISRGFFLKHTEGQSNTQMFLGRSFVATINRHHNPQLLSARFAAIAAALTKAPASEHPALLAAFTDSPLRVEIHDQPTLKTSNNPRVELIRDLIEFQLQGAPDTARVDTRPGTEGSDEAAPEQLVTEIALPDGRWLAITNSDFAIEGPSRLLFALLASMALLIAALSVWTARWLTRPISAFAAAAERFGASTEAIPLVESGPKELRAATRTFNQMQERLRRFVSDRTLMVAAMSHDLKTPLTRIRLRTELIGDGTQQGKIFADIDEMTAMIESTLAFARDDAKREAPLLVDLGALVESVCENAIDTGHDVEMSSARQAVLVTCRPVAISRAVANLVDNAVKYGGCARVTLERMTDRAIVTIDDDGPGIADEEREKVFAPFYRIEGSRNRDTGGVGLGLAVARNSAREHGGDLTLGTSEGGGLRAKLELPAVEARDGRSKTHFATIAVQQAECVPT